MDETRRLEMRRAHAKHTHTCHCGVEARGNGGWASHTWSCRTYQTRGHDTLDRWKHNPKRCDVCEKAEANWQPNQSLPGNYRWGYAARSRYIAMGRPVIRHVIVGVESTDAGHYGRMLCSAGWAITGNGGGEYCRACVALVRDQLDDD